MKGPGSFSLQIPCRGTRNIDPQTLSFLLMGPQKVLGNLHISTVTALNCGTIRGWDCLTQYALNPEP